LPDFIGLIATILESADRPCCLVLPERTGVAVAVSTLLAVSQLQRAVPEILRSHAAVSFSEGDRVLVLPLGLVYEYQGFFVPGQFRLKVLNRNESRSLPVHEVARLEKTVRKMPKGSGNSDLGKPQPTVLGTLVGIPGTVNRNLLRNYVLLLGSKKKLREQLATWIVGVRDDAAESRPLEKEVPFGEVAEDGTLRFFDPYVASGEPLAAVASRPEELVTFCARLQPFSRAILVDDVELVARNLQSYDSITESQRMVVLADESQHEYVKVLYDRGCNVWHLSPEQVLIGGRMAPNTGLFRRLLGKVSNIRNLVVSESPCLDGPLSQTADVLLDAARAIRQRFTTRADLLRG
jgi:hypothetical protein